MVSAVFTGVASLLGVQKIGRYEVLSHLASGGMGQVYLARSTGLGGFERQVVVKTLDLSITDDDDAFVTMFLDEARLVGALHHQYIAPVYEVGCDDEGRYYLVMDYVHGETAEAVYRASAERSWPVPLSFALTVVSCVASALDYAHNLCAADGTSLDIVHRDISLSNVMIGYDGAVKLIDFGIAKAANRATKTQVGTLKGKIGYLAPEQVLRKHVDHRADIFALGIVLYELTTAKRAFRESSDLVTLERITSGDVRPPSEFTPNYPPELERIVLKALEVDPERRYQDAFTMGRELERLAAQMNLPLGHAAIKDVMMLLFGEARRRRRMARGSHDVNTNPSIRVVEEDDEKTPVVEMPTEDAELRTGRARALRPTTPLGDPARRDSISDHVAIGSSTDKAAELPLEDSATVMDAGLPIRPSPPPTKRFKTPSPVPTLEGRATPVPSSATARPSSSSLQAPQGRASSSSLSAPARTSSPSLPAAARTSSPFLQAPGRASSPTTPVPGRTSSASPSLPLPATTLPPRGVQHTPTGPQPITTTPDPYVAPPRMPTGPQLPVVVFHTQGQHIADAPTHITGMRAERDDPTDASTRLAPPLRVTPPEGHAAESARTHRWAPSNLTHAVVAKVKPAISSAARTWLFLCALFAIAVIAAILIAVL